MDILPLDISTPTPHISDVVTDGDSFDLSKYKINCEWNTIHYIPNFITAEEEAYLVEKVSNSPKPKWTQLSNRRLQNWGGVPHPKGMIAEDLPYWLKKYNDKIGSMGIFDGKTPNHVLVNEYEAGQGIMPHLDGNLFYPRITTINLSSHTVLNFYNPIKSENENGTNPAESISWEDRLAFSMLLEPRSLLILQDQCYDHFLHGIDEITQDELNSSIINIEQCSAAVGDKLKRSTRISLTIRFVPKTTKTLIRLGR